MKPRFRRVGRMAVLHSIDNVETLSAVRPSFAMEARLCRLWDAENADAHGFVFPAINKPRRLRTAGGFNLLRMITKLARNAGGKKLRLLCRGSSCRC